MSSFAEATDLAMFVSRRERSGLARARRFIGGADIAEELSQSGELEQKLAEALGPDYGSGRAEKVVAVT